MTQEEIDGPAIRSPRLTIRPLAPGDEARLQAVFEAAADHFQALAARPGPDPDAAEREIAASADKAARRIALLVLDDTGEEVGALGWWAGNPEPGMALLGTIVVVPEHRGKGLAREALAALEAALVEAGITELRTAFPRRRLRVHPVVKALGFREMSIAEHTKLGMAGAGTSLWAKPIG